MYLNTPLLPDEWHIRGLLINKVNVYSASPFFQCQPGNGRIRGLLINKVNVYSASPFFQCQPGNGRKVTCLVRFWRFSIRVNDES